MMMNEAELRKVMRTRLKTVATLPPTDQIAWENRTFDPPEIPTELGENILFVREQIRILDEPPSSTGFIETIGETLWMVETPSGKGTQKADQLAKKIAEAFEAGQALLGEDITVILEHTDRRPYREDPERPLWIFKTIAVRWRVFTPRG